MKKMREERKKEKKMREGRKCSSVKNRSFGKKARKKL